MAWFDRPAASIPSTSRSRAVSGSTMPGTAARRRRGDLQCLLAGQDGRIQAPLGTLHLAEFKPAPRIPSRPA
jgi:hypothetical protein